jgi:uncharacterized protein (TIGR03437 family)
LVLAVWNAPVQAQGTLTSTPVSLAFTWQSGGTLPSGKALSVKSGSTAAPYVVTINPGTALWLTASPETGSLPAALTVRVNPSSLSVGVYTANVQVAVAGFTTAVIPVTVTVTAPLPTLTLSASNIDFVTPTNPPPDQTLILNTTGGPISFIAAPQGATWVDVYPRNGVVLPGIPTLLTISADSSSLTPQAAAYSGKLVITATGVPPSNKTQNITVTMLANPPSPTISSLWPSAALANTGALTVTVRGTGFYKGTGVKVTGQATPLKTTFVSSTVLWADLPASMLSTAGTLPVVVTNPAPGGDSPASNFTVSSTPVVQAVVSSASYSTNPVSPGQLVSLFGHGIGPDTPAGMTISGGYVATVVSGVSVTIDAKSAPIIYVSKDFITIQVPYDVTIGTAKAVAVNNNGVIANGTVDTALLSPGIFTLDASGKGQAAAITFSQQSGNYAVNGASAPARAGDIVLLFLTGEGDYSGIVNPTGYVVPPTLNPLPQVTPPPVVTIGGAPANVQYAGPMGTGILGLLQMNVAVPAESTKGNAVPVTIDFGNGFTVQSGVTLVVK